MAIQVGIIKTLNGTATATSPDGSKRELQIGDRVYADEIIITGSAGAIEIEFADGNIMDLGRQSQILLNSETINLNEVEKLDVEDDVLALQQALLEGKDPTQIGEATATGILSEGNEGVTAETIDYLAPEAPVTSGFETDGPFVNNINENNLFDKLIISDEVNIIDDTPKAVDNAFLLNEDNAFTGSLSSNDTKSADGGNTWAVETGPAHGSVSINADGTFTYTPADNYNGSDSFTYAITDADGDTSIAAVNLTIDSVNDVPVAVDDSFTLNEDTAITGTLIANDTESADGGNTWAVETGPAHGSVSINADGTFTYTPADNYNGSDSFTYAITDADGDVSTASVNLHITALGDVLIDANETRVINENSEATGNVLDNTQNVDGSSSVINFSIDNQTANAGDTITIDNVGSLTIAANGIYSFLPDSGYTGAVPIASYTVGDNTDSADTATSTLTIQINSVDAMDDGYESTAQGEFSVAAFTAGQEQSAPDVASLNDGGYVVAWSEVSGNSYRGADTNDINNDGDLDDAGEILWNSKVNHDIFLQRYDANGDTVGDAIRVNTFVTNTSLEGGRDQHDVNVIGLENGNYLVTWMSDDHNIEFDRYDNGSSYLEAQIYDDSGAPVSEEFTIARAEYDPLVALPDGGFIVTWAADARLHNSDGYDYHGNANTNANPIDNPIISDFSEATADGDYAGKGFGIVAQRYDASGNPVGDRLLVNTQMADDQIDSDIALLSDGSAIMTWQSANQDGDGFGIYSQKLQLTANGLEKVGSETAINSTIAGDQTNPEVTALSNGTAVITWESTAAGQGLAMQIIAPNGSLIGNEIALSATGSNPVVTETDSGFVAVWQDGDDIISQLFDSTGVAVGNALTVNENTIGIQSEPAVTSLEDGGYIITYESANGIAGFRFNEDGSPYFQVQDTFAMDEDTVLTIDASDLVANDSDPEGHGFEITSVQDSVNGTATLSADSSTILFTPDTDYNGPATFTYTVEDTLGAVNTATVHLMVNGVSESASILSGDDIIFAGNGDDTLTGGAGADEFVWYKAAAQGSHDVVTDFNAAEGDTLNLADLLSDGSHSIEGLAANDSSGEHLQLSIKDNGGNVVQTIDLTSVVTTDATAASMLDTLLLSGGIDDGI